MERKKIALTIAGTDPTGGAGLQADLRTFNSLGVFGLSVASVLTAQNTEGVQSIHELPPEFISEQLDVLVSDIRPDALKTGMLYTADAVRITAEKIKRYSLQNLVIDPVTISSTGVQLLEKDVPELMKRDLFPLAKVITPNIYEASLFAGININDEGEMKEGAYKLKEFGPSAVIITGGHLDGRAADMLYDGREFIFLEAEKLEGAFHGTGCIFSAAITACLAKGDNIREAFRKAKGFVTEAVKSAVSFGKGMNILAL